MAAVAILKFDAISLQFDRSSPILVKTLGLQFRTHLLHCIVAKIQHNGRNHPQFFEKYLSFLYYLTKFSTDIATLIQNTYMESKKL